MAAGKSTLSKELAREYDAVLLCEDEILSTLYPTEISTIEDYLNYSLRLKVFMKSHVIGLLEKGNSVVMDFPANTPRQRAWFKELYESAGVEHTLHFLNKSDELCKMQLKKRNKTLPENAPLTSEATFDAMTKFFEAPRDEEGFNTRTYT